MRLMIIAVLLLALFTCIKYLSAYDTMDNEATQTRSGLSVATDNATGVQYVKFGIFGGITPRINADGTIYKGK